jgi:hypothetical protein
VGLGAADSASGDESPKAGGRSAILHPIAGQGALRGRDSRPHGPSWGVRPAVITGFNTNIRFGGRLFHVQTEDSGLRHPHVISHLYYQGTILASEKSSYAERVESGDLENVVRSLMERQHKAMVAQLKNGGFDSIIAERLGGQAPQASAPPPAPAAPTSSSSAAPAVSRDAARAFGERIVSPKPLDELILDYLVDKARDRPGRPPGRPRKKP